MGQGLGVRADASCTWVRVHEAYALDRPPLATPPPGTPRHATRACTRHGRRAVTGSGAMGSKRGVRNSQIAPQVNLSRTIWSLAPVLGPCCKNRLVPKAPGYLRLSYPLKILSRTRTLP